MPRHMNFLSQAIGDSGHSVYAQPRVLDWKSYMSKSPLLPPYGFDDLLEIMRQLRTPETGCSWDLAQGFETIAPYTIEEAYEVSDAIERGDMKDLSDELGDLLLQVGFHAQIAADEDHFEIADVTHAICEKMIRRHPHVFGDDAQRTASEQTSAWEEIKASERASKSDADESALAGVARALPALLRVIISSSLAT